MYCNNCGKINQKNSKFCQHCGIKITNAGKTRGKIMNRELGASDNTGMLDQHSAPYPYVVSLKKFIILNILTGGMYQLYWFFKQFKSFQFELDWKVSKRTAALFAQFTAYSLFKRIAKVVKELDETKRLDAVLLAIAYFVISIWWYLPGAYGFLGILCFIPLIPVQKAINYYWETKYTGRIVRSKFGFGNVVWSIIGVLILLLAIYGTYGLDEKNNDKFFKSLETKVSSLQDGSVPSTNDKKLDKKEDSNWISFTEESKGFTEMFPQQPVHELDSSGTYPYNSYTTEVNENLLYKIGVVNYDDTVDASTPLENLNLALNNMASYDAKTELLSTKNIFHQGYHAKEFSMRLNGFLMEGRIIFVQDRLYQVLVCYLETDGRPSDYDKFISTFKIL